MLGGGTNQAPKKVTLAATPPYGRGALSARVLAAVEAGKPHHQLLMSPLAEACLMPL